MSAYIIFIRKSLQDPVAFKAYNKLARQASVGHVIEAKAFYGAVACLENAETDGVAILKFPDMAQAQAWYQSEDYQRAKQQRDLAGEYTVILTEGLAD